MKNVKMKYAGKARVAEHVLKHMEEHQMHPNPPKDPNKVLPKNKSGIVIINPVTKEQYITSPFIYKQKLYWNTLPHPVTMFFSIAVENARNADELFNNFMEYKDDSRIIQTRQPLFDALLKHRIIAIIQLQAGIEAFLNFIIPHDANIQLQEKGVMKQYDKRQIEYLLSFKRKLYTIKDFYPKETNKISISNYKKLTDNLLAINRVRKKLVHIITARRANNLEEFYETYDELVNIDLSDSIKVAIEFVNLIKPGWIEFEEMVVPSQFCLKDVTKKQMSIYNYTTDYVISETDDRLIF